MTRDGFFTAKIGKIYSREGLKRPSFFDGL